LTSSAQNFVWTVPANVAGTTIPCFCVRHCQMQTGSIIVRVPIIPGDLDRLLANWTG